VAVQVHAARKIALLHHTLHRAGCDANRISALS